MHTSQIGQAVLERLSSEPSTRDIPVIIVSMDQSILDDVTLNSARYRGQVYLVKPLDLETFMEMVHRLVGVA